MPSADLSAVNNFSAVPQTGAFIANVPSKEKFGTKFTRLKIKQVSEFP